MGKIWAEVEIRPLLTVLRKRGKEVGEIDVYFAENCMCVSAEIVEGFCMPKLMISVNYMSVSAEIVEGFCMPKLTILGYEGRVRSGLDHRQDKLSLQVEQLVSEHLVLIPRINDNGIVVVIFERYYRMMCLQRRHLKASDKSICLPSSADGCAEHIFRLGFHGIYGTGLVVRMTAGTSSVASRLERTIIENDNDSYATPFRAGFGKAAQGMKSVRGEDATSAKKRGIDGRSARIWVEVVIIVGTRVIGRRIVLVGLPRETKARGPMLGTYLVRDKCYSREVQVSGGKIQGQVYHMTQEDVGVMPDVVAGSEVGSRHQEQNREGGKAQSGQYIASWAGLLQNCGMIACGASQVANRGDN
uniref:Uncharacterized protein n=1 Tax=Salix viminalis TaxID=40686 RepID=A0A6N2KY11_SALVM